MRQALAIGIESCRLVLVQKLLQGFGLDPMSSLYYMAPVCLALNAVLLLPVEGFQVFEDAVELVGIPYLVLKCVALPDLAISRRFSSRETIRTRLSVARGLTWSCFLQRVPHLCAQHRLGFSDRQGIRTGSDARRRAQGCAFSLKRLLARRAVRVM